ncbi:hypothetical protein IEQ34_020677 [Dendrobium chrysotoxum]|uniref:Rnh202 triple barrel domain-containing protein n=1 Tax=Dendrobium chrysotoxum TaxID=161865 RepID=A0AAV7FKL7_DENCH|nr:hypothetical protein IEQ34_020677 [Dendrobium chrysotoxum]
MKGGNPRLSAQSSLRCLSALVGMAWCDGMKEPRLMICPMEVSQDGNRSENRSGEGCILSLIHPKSVLCLDKATLFDMYLRFIVMAHQIGIRAFFGTYATKKVVALESKMEQIKSNVEVFVHGRKGKEIEYEEVDEESFFHQESPPGALIKGGSGFPYEGTTRRKFFGGGNSTWYMLKDGLLQEFHWFKQSYGSWFLGDYVCEDGSLYISTPVDPIFILLPIFCNARLKKGKEQGVFRQIDEILFNNDYPSYQRLVSLAEQSMQLVCEVKDFLSPTKIRVSMAAKKVDVLEERLEGEIGQLKTEISNLHAQLSDVKCQISAIHKKMDGNFFSLGEMLKKLLESQSKTASL